MASNDKRFVVEEAARGSQVMAASLDSAALLELLMPYIKHKNPKVSSGFIASAPNPKLPRIPL